MYKHINILRHTHEGKVHWDISNTKTERKHPAQEDQVSRHGRPCQKQHHSVFASPTPSLPRLLFMTIVRDPWAFIATEGKVCINMPLRNLESFYSETKNAGF